MRAVQVAEFGQPEDLVVTEVHEPPLGSDEVLVDVAAAGVNFPDLLVVGGRYQKLPPRPFSPGKELAGVVRAVGRDVSRISVGERVQAQVEYGAFAERVAVPEAVTARIPQSMSFTEAAAFGLVFTTAHYGLVRRSCLRAGDVVLVTGAGGGVGSAGVQVAKALGATVIAAARDEARCELAREQGADHAILTDPATLRDEVRALTDGRGADIILENVGGDVLAQAIRAAAWEGRVVVVGFASGDQPDIKPGHLLVKNISLVGLQGSDYRDRDPAYLRSTMGDLFRMYEAGELTVPVDATFALESASHALARVRDGGIKGKLVLTTGTE